jgi:hypothetical protein
MTSQMSRAPRLESLRIGANRRIADRALAAFLEKVAK